MTDITIIIPLHKFDDKVKVLLENALDSIVENEQNYVDGKLIPMIVAPGDILEKVGEAIGESRYYKACRNHGDTDFCSQVNFAVGHVDTDYFSILEYDDKYTSKWFKMVHDYYHTNESVSVFLPINIIWSESAPGQYQYINEIAWTSSFSNEIGYLDYDCLQDYPSFNLTGGVFNTNDFKEVGCFKPSLKVSFNYELLLRMTKMELKVFVVPKEGYVHCIGREGSLTDEYGKTMDRDEIRKWFDLAKIECSFKEDRKSTISKLKEEELK